MDKNVDEQILEIMNIQKQEENVDLLSNSIKIGDRYYLFEEKCFFDEKIKLIMPKDFKHMSEKNRKIKYASENRPEIIMSNEEGTTAITLNIIDSPLNDDGILELIEGMKAIVQRSNPSNIFYDCMVEVVNGKNIGYFDYKSSALDSYIYNIMFFLELGGKTLMGTFSCKYSDYINWREIAFSIIRSIEISK